MVQIENISISGNRVAVETKNSTYQFVVQNHDDKFASYNHNLKVQFNLAFSICDTIEDVEKHMNLNGWECELEDIY